MRKASRNTIFARNLGVLCTEKRSVAEVCRALGFNRQQFARYLSGETLPSPHNLKRIATGFGVTVEDLLNAEDIDSARAFHGPVQGSRTIDGLIGRAFPGDMDRLRTMLGYHYMFFVEPFEPDKIMRTLIHVYERDGKVLTKTVERLTYQGTEATHFAKFEGMMSLHGSLLFLLEFETTHVGSIVESVFFGPPNRRIDMLTGLTLGVTKETYHRPYASPIALKFLGRTVNIRERLSGPGLFRPDDRRLDPKIRSLFRKYRADPEMRLPLLPFPP